MGNRSDEWRKPTNCAITLLAMESIPEVEGATTDESDDFHLFNTLLVICLFSLLGMLGIVWVMKDMIVMIASKVRNVLMSANEETEIENEPVLENDMQRSVGLSHATIENNQMNEDDDTFDNTEYHEECSPNEERRWKKTI